ncbi:phosphomannomutase [Rheinheimera sp.]|uniref:phosphomannomutase n=1 Tax=Rheinheimera sp. TaxID=1869214 RepID=UPI00307FA8CF
MRVFGVLSYSHHFFIGPILIQLNAFNIQFGTSGARGLVVDFSYEACWAYTAAFVQLCHEQADCTELVIAMDLRPSSPVILQHICSALRHLGVEPLFCGVLPTPALAAYAKQLNLPAIMITGSHIPFDRNGLKFYTRDGEITKQHEAAMISAHLPDAPIASVQNVVVSDHARACYLKRYTNVFSADLFRGKRIGLYQHSAAGRDLYTDLFQQLGAQVVELGRSETFVPIDTEAVSDEDKARAKTWCAQYQLDLLFSTDGDGDRPLVADEQGNWFRGDVLGAFCAKALRIRHLAVPVSCNTAIELSGWFETVVRTRIGSPYVIEQFEKIQGSKAGFEANGGFLLGSDLPMNGQILPALPTRDAVLPLLAIVQLADGAPLSELYQQLPARFTSSDRVQNIATDLSRTLIASCQQSPELLLKALALETAVCSLNTTDGLRISLVNGDIIHLRPSGNAPELRCYAESDSQAKAEFLVDTTLNWCRQQAAAQGGN